MFDGLKILNALVDAEALKQNPLLDPDLHVKERTGAIESQTAQYNGLRFTIKGKFVQIQGSLHKYANGGLHNHDDFGADRVAVAVAELWERFGIGRNNPLNNIEFGVNVCIPFSPKKFLERLICHKGKPFVKIVDDEVNYYQCQHEHFILKIYDKGAQYRQTENLLRFEVKVLKMQFLETKGVSIKTLGDLTNSSNYERLGVILRGYFDEILIDEPKIIANTLKLAQRDLLNTGRNPKTWVRPNRKDFGGKTEYDRARTEYDRRLSAFRSLVKNHPNAEHWQQAVSQLIADKWAQLSNGTCSKFTAPTFIGECSKFTELRSLNDTGSKTENVANLRLKYSEDLLHPPQSDTTNSTRVCVVTGANISHQKITSLFVAEATLRADVDLLDTIAKKQRKNSRKRAEHDAAYYAAHNVRNQYTNPANNLRKRLLRIQNENGLFAAADVVRLSEEKRELLKRWEGTPYGVQFGEKLNSNRSSSCQTK